MHFTFLSLSSVAYFFTFFYLATWEWIPTALLLYKEELSILSEYSTFKIWEREGKGKGSRGERCQKAPDCFFQGAELPSILIFIGHF